MYFSKKDENSYAEYMGNVVLKVVMNPLRNLGSGRRDKTNEARSYKSDAFLIKGVDSFSVRPDVFVGNSEYHFRISVPEINIWIRSQEGTNRYPFRRTTKPFVADIIVPFKENSVYDREKSFSEAESAFTEKFRTAIGKQIIDAITTDEPSDDCWILILDEPPADNVLPMHIELYAFELQK